MKFINSKIIFFISILLCFVVLTKNINNKVYAFDFNLKNLLHIGGNDDSETDTNVNQLEKEIEELEQKLEETKSKKQSLSREIESINTQIQLTQTKIYHSNEQITKKQSQLANLDGDIHELENRIVKLKDSIVFQTNLLAERVRARYKTGDSSTIFVLLGADTLDSVIQQSQYLKLLEEQDNEVLNKMNQTKDAYGMQKDVFEEKKDEVEELKKQLENERYQLQVYEAELANKKYERNALLERTQNDESKFQQQLAEAQAELNQIVGAASVLQNTEPREVKKGELIGYQGNSGYSFGEHLHFGVYRYGSFKDIDGWNWYYANYVNPAKKLKNKSVYWNTGCESPGNKNVGEGDWAWPLSNPTISQGYGHTCWSNIYYGGKDHPAYDMYGSTGASVYAVDDGKAYFCRNCLGDGGNGVFIFHDDDYMTVYWHLR